MRSLVLILVLALLPLRMWAADTMAVRMAQQEAAAAGMSRMAGMAAMPDDCPMKNHGPSDAGAGHHDDPQQPASNCTVCHMGGASTCAPQLAVGQERSPTGPPPWGSARYASAEVAPDLRPPIA